MSEYHGETGDSAYARMETHKQDVEGKKDSNAFHKHLDTLITFKTSVYLR